MSLANASPPDPDPSPDPVGRARVRRSVRIGVVAAAMLATLAAVSVVVDRPLGDRGPGATGAPAGAGVAATPPDAGQVGGLAPFGPAPTPPTPTVDPADAAIQSLLDLRSRAVEQGRADSFLATDAIGNPAFLSRQRILADNLMTLPFTQWTYRLGERRYAADAVAGPLLRRYGLLARAYDVRVDYRLGGFDPSGTQGRRVMVFLLQGATWKVVDDIDTGVFREPWDVTPLRAITGTRVLLLVAGNPVRTDAVLRQSEAAVKAVSAIWGRDWSRRVVVVVPSSQTQLGTMLRRPGRSYSTLAAVATAEKSDDPGGPAVNRVWINPSGFSRITELGRSIVLRHEITHVATGAAVPSTFAIWLEEGFADYIGYLGSGVSQDIIASELLDDARAGRVPSALPTKRDFRSTNPSLSQAYEGAWWAARLIAQTYGQDALVRVYRTALAQPDPSTAVDAALRQQVGISTAQLTSRWRASIKAAAS